MICTTKILRCESYIAAKLHFSFLHDSYFTIILQSPVTLINQFEWDVFNRKLSNYSSFLKKYMFDQRYNFYRLIKKFLIWTFYSSKEVNSSDLFSFSLKTKLNLICYNYYRSVPMVTGMPEESSRRVPGWQEHVLSLVAWNLTNPVCSKWWLLPVATWRRGPHSWTWALNFSFETLSSVGLKSNCFDGTGGHGRRPCGNLMVFIFTRSTYVYRLKKECFFPPSPPLHSPSSLHPAPSPLFSHRHSSYLLSQSLFLYLPFTAGPRRDKGLALTPEYLWGHPALFHGHDPRVLFFGAKWTIEAYTDDTMVIHY